MSNLDETILLSDDDDDVDDHWNRGPDDDWLLNDDAGEELLKDRDSQNISSRHSNGEARRISPSSPSSSRHQRPPNTRTFSPAKRRSLTQQEPPNPRNFHPETNENDEPFSKAPQFLSQPQPSDSNSQQNGEEEEAKIVPEQNARKRGRRPARPTVLDEFFGVYCLISRSPNKYFKNRCYIGYTVDPNRRIRQHNAGKQFGGAGKTDHRGPWDMVCIVHGFPNSVSALRFEWAWQNPDKSRRLSSLKLRKRPKESAFAYRFRIVSHMLNSDPWQRLALTFRWLSSDCEMEFSSDIPLPKHMKLVHGLVEKTSTLIPQLAEQYTDMRKCAICLQQINNISELLRCFNVTGQQQQRSCGVHFHMRCLAKLALQRCNEYRNQLIPISFQCPNCNSKLLWGDLIRDQRLLISIQQSLPKFDATADGADDQKPKIPTGKLVKL